MSREITPFQRLRVAYRRRFIAAALLTAFAFGGGHAGDHALLIALSFAAGLIALILLIELTQRWHQLRQIRVVEDGAAPYGFTGSVDPGTAAKDLGRRKLH
jgi:hypothetical protein